MRFFVTATLERLDDGNSEDASATRFIVSTHWRLNRLFPNELAQAEKPFVDLLMTEINAAADAGQINPDGRWDAWFIDELLRAVYHYYAYAAKEEDDMNVVKERLWRFCHRPRRRAHLTRRLRSAAPLSVVTGTCATMPA